MSDKKPYPQSTGSPKYITTIGELNNIFQSVETELRTHYSGISQPKFSLKALAERIKSFVIHELNARLNAKEWDAVYGVCRDFYRGGVGGFGHGGEMGRFLNRLHDAGRARRVDVGVGSSVGLGSGGKEKTKTKTKKN